MVDIVSSLIFLYIEIFISFTLGSLLEIDGHYIMVRNDYEYKKEFVKIQTSIVVLGNHMLFLVPFTVH